MRYNQMTGRFLIFSGHNDRAAIALCRYFELAGLNFAIVGHPEGDIIQRSRYANHVVLIRTDLTVTRNLFENTVKATHGEPLFYCPTTEFINLQLLHNPEVISDLPIKLFLPPVDVYDRLTNKASSTAFFGQEQGILVPRSYSFTQARAPCVFKPNENLFYGRILYPLICKTESELHTALKECDQNMYTVQEYIEGTSRYLCGFIDENDEATCFWQRNLGQQPGGKSIILAKEETALSQSLLELQDILLSKLTSITFQGPFMIEIRFNSFGGYFIEINPRFWGPLQLTLDVCPNILANFSSMFETSSRRFVPRNSKRPAFYLWREGMDATGMDALDEKETVVEALTNAQDWDVFSRKDFSDVRS